MPPTDIQINPIQAGLHNLAKWFESLPKPQIRLPGQAHDHSTDSIDKSRSSVSEVSTSGTSVSGSEHSTVSYRLDTASASAKDGSGALRVGPVDKDDLGRATWTFLHVLAAQFPDHPTRSQQKDARSLVR